MSLPLRGQAGRAWSRIGLAGLMACALMMCPLSKSASSSPAARQAEPEDRGSQRYHTHTATFNIQGGRNPNNHNESNAHLWYNEDVAAIGLQNTVQSRAVDRGPALHGLAVQEACRTHWYNVTYELRVWNFIIDNNPWALQERVAPAIYDGPGSANLSAGCGAWFGLGSLHRGTITASSATAYAGAIQDGERRVWLCTQSHFLLCNTHISNGAHNKDQIDAYRNTAAYLSALNPSISTFAAGDFNAQPTAYGNLWRLQWEFDGFWDADNSNFQPTYRITQTTIDYIWRSRPAAYAFDAWVPTSGISDHYWKQGYW